MVETKVIINGKDLLVPVVTDKSIFISGKLIVALFLTGDCVDMFYFVSPTEPQVDMVELVGDKITIVFKSNSVVVVSGDISFMNLLKEGKVVKTHHVKVCDDESVSIS